MIKINNRDVESIIYNSLSIAYVYKGLQLVWNSIRSCFGKGYWINNAPFLNTDGWKNNN